MINHVGKWWSVSLMLLTLCSCSQREGLAPVVEEKWHVINRHAKQHVVVRGETLYAIAFRYDQDYRRLALMNHLSSPYTVRVGQVLRVQAVGVSSPAYASVSKQNRYTDSKPALHASPQVASREPKQQYAGWSWPAQGRVAAYYAPQQGKKGINIAGRKGEKIHAAAGGVVAYAGNGLKGYGNLIIIKHNNQYLTAYGNNLRNLVREGQHINARQVIAEMGIVDQRYWGVHFEIRRAGHPVNPLNYLQKG